MPEPTQPPHRRHVFVYGTLRRGEVRDINRLQPAPAFVGMARVQAVLYDLGPYPGLLLGGQGWVTGEVYAISAELERQLDTIEDVWPEPTGEYSKREVAVQLRPGAAADPALEGQTVSCLVYEINPERTRGRPLIRSGDWRASRSVHTGGGAAALPDDIS